MTGAALGLSPIDQAIASRRKPQSPLSPNMEQYENYLIDEHR